MTGISIAGCGARTPLGFDRASSAAAVRAGIAAIDEHPFMIDRFGAPMKVTRDAALDPALEGAERLAALALAAAREALDGAGETGRLALVMSLGEVRPGQDEALGAAASERLAEGLKQVAPLDRVAAWMGGHAGGIAAMEAGAKLIANGRADAVLAGGVDSYLVPETLEWLDETEQLQSEENLFGFCPGEAAGFVLLRAAGAGDGQAALEIAAFGAAHEKNRIKTEDICLGEGLAAAFRGARTGLGEEELVDRIICDMNGERYRGNEYGFAVLKNAGMFRDAADFESPADCWGDVGAASGPLFAALVLEAEARGYVKGPLSLIWAGSEAGQRGAALLRRKRRAG